MALMRRVAAGELTVAQTTAKNYIKFMPAGEKAKNPVALATPHYIFHKDTVSGQQSFRDLLHRAAAGELVAVSSQTTAGLVYKKAGKVVALVVDQDVFYNVTLLPDTPNQSPSPH